MPSQFELDQMTLERDAALSRAEDAESKNSKLVGHIGNFDDLEKKATAYDALQKEFDALSIRWTEREKELDLDTLKFKSAQYDALLDLLRDNLKTAKRKQENVSEEKLSAFYTSVNSMTNITVMARMLEDMGGGSGGQHSEFLQIISGATPTPAEKPQIHNDAYLEEQKRKAMASY